MPGTISHCRFMMAQLRNQCSTYLYYTGNSQLKQKASLLPHKKKTEERSSKTKSSYFYTYIYKSRNSTESRKLEKANYKMLMAQMNQNSQSS